MSEWNTSEAMDAAAECTDDLTRETTDCADTTDAPMGDAWELPPSAAAQAAEYVRSFEGFEKAADYVERHFEGDAFTPGDVIPISTRNQDLCGDDAHAGVPFERKAFDLTDGLTLSGVFPAFDSLHRVELGEAANDMSLYKQFSACRADFQDHMYDDRAKLEGVTFGAMERMDLPHGFAPEGFTWNHNPELGSYDLVSGDDHGIGHTGGNALWGK